MSDTATPSSPVVNINDVPEISTGEGAWASAYRPLTPSMKQASGRLGANLSRLSKGQVGCPFHTHQIEDEIFYVISGHGVLRYGDTLYEIGPGDCISCPAGTGVAHQIANPYDEDLVYFCVGRNDPNEVATYPDSGKIMVRGLHKVGYLRESEYMDGEPVVPKIFALIAERP